MGLSRTVTEINGDFSRKSQIFPTLCVFCAPADGILLGIGYRHWGQKLERWRYQAEQNVWRYLQPSGYSAPRWRTDGHRATAKTALTHSVPR